MNKFIYMLMSIILLFIIVMQIDLFKTNMMIKGIAPCERYVAVPVNTCTNSWWESVKEFLS